MALGLTGHIFVCDHPLTDESIQTYERMVGPHLPPWSVKVNVTFDLAAKSQFVDSEGGWIMALCQVSQKLIHEERFVNHSFFFFLASVCCSRFSAVTDQGIKNHTGAEAVVLAVRG